LNIFNKAYSLFVTKEQKNSIWREITATVHNEHPDCTEKTQEQVEKSGKIVWLQSELQ
jgi:Tol biopolymer transport system component